MNAIHTMWKDAARIATWSAARTLNRFLALGMLLFATSLQTAGAAAPQLNSLKDINFAGLPGNQVQITFELSQPVSNPASFTIDNPARIAFDLPATKSELAKRSQSIGIGPAKSITAVEVKGRTRVVLNLFEMVPYETRTDGNKIIVVLGTAGQRVSAPAATAPADSTTASISPTITSVDFRRGEQGEGRVIVTLSDPSIPVDMRQEAGKIVLDFSGATLPEELERRLDVTDFATPVKLVDTENKRNGVRMEITPIGEYEHLAYQSDNQFTVEVRETTKEEKELAKKEQFGYTGERLSLNFQDIEVRSVLQLLSDFTGQNIVVSDSVTGNLSLRMQNVPWDQALDIVLKTKGLAKRENGNVILIAPSEEIAAREKLELESMKQIEELAPLYSDLIQVNYAKATDLAELLSSEDSSQMSERGKVSVDERTNTLLIQDTADKLEQIRRLVSRLDIPVRQVLIESRIVLANNDFTRELGVKFGLSHNSTARDNETQFVLGGKQNGDVNYADTITAYEVPGGSSNEGLLVNLPATNPSGALGIALGKLGSNLLALELSAMQLEDRGEIISSPRVITSNQQEAVIQQGVEIPYQRASSSGATAVTFKEAVLELRVTPQITPDDRIIMDLKVSKDSVGQIFSGVPSIDTRNVETRVLVDNGETLVLGGIYEQARGKETERVPFFGELPGVGWLFRTDRKTNEKSEMLIFVTPKLIKQGISIQ
ncbi:type IV pilus assembly protein PilQ [Thiogranum longum]|uniref:Type IV pilus assembly protein PilQ n=2 Tax=Thiogranum longum TaxID=1537524 RepID=A0A4R1H5L6_9GAMM|nr:type IV pilus assembly protein PilQ [Thiogranum longum]